MVVYAKSLAKRYLGVKIFFLLSFIYFLEFSVGYNTWPKKFINIDPAFLRKIMEIFKKEDLLVKRRKTNIYFIVSLVCLMLEMDC